MIIKCEYQNYQICSNAGCAAGCVRKKQYQISDPNSGVTILPPGCICPPTSEQTCQNPTCPRKPIDFTVRSNTGAPHDR